MSTSRCVPGFGGRHEEQWTRLSWPEGDKQGSCRAISCPAMTLRNGKVLLPAPSPGLTTILERGPTGSPEGQLLPVAMVAIALGCAELPRGPSDSTYLFSSVCDHSVERPLLDSVSASPAPSSLTTVSSPGCCASLPLLLPTGREALGQSQSKYKKNLDSVWHTEISTGAKWAALIKSCRFMCYTHTSDIPREEWPGVLSDGANSDAPESTPSSERQISNTRDGKAENS